MNQRFAKCSIICIGDVILKRVYRGILRKEDVRAERKDEVEMYNSFRPGDIILARIVSINFLTNFKRRFSLDILSAFQLPQNELHCYQLSTAENELGVVVAHAAESGPQGVPMVPVSWTEMQCPQTLVKELRKVAKIVPESAVQEATNCGVTT